MPDWTPNWSNVVFDHAAAADAAEACRSASRSIASVTGTAGGARGDAVADWSGAYRDDFDAEEPVVLEDLEETRTDLIGLAAAIESGASQARAEQTRREQDRDRWRREQASEEAADPGPPLGGGRPIPE